MSSPAQTDRSPDWLALARRVVDAVEAEAGHVPEEPVLPERVVHALRESRLFALALPRALGGFEAEPRAQIEVYEEVARADGSTSWCLMAGALASGFAGAFSDEASARTMFPGAGSSVHAGQLAPRGQAVAVPGGYRLQGRWSFGSGLAHAQWVLAGCTVIADGSPRLADNGLPELRVACVPRDAVQLRGNWNVLGLRETGSFDYELAHQFVPEGMTFPLLSTEPERGGALYRMGILQLTSAGHAGFALGVARRALDEIAALAPGCQRLGENRLVDQPTFQLEYARRETALQAARLLVLDAFDTAFALVAAGDPLPAEQRARVRLATTHATEVAAEACTFAYRAAGSESLRVPSRIQRCFRDMSAATQHIFVGEKTWLDAAQVLLGTAPENPIL